MAFVNYKNTNNASSLLISDITASATTILITDWDQVLFPSSFPFLLTLEHLDANDNVILREIVKVVANNQNTFTIERSAWTCVQDDTATNRVQDNTAHAFSSWDRVSLYWTAEQVADIQNNLELKWNQDAIANVYDNSLTYAIWDIVVYKGDRYICTTAVSTPEEFDPTKWTKVNIQNELNDHETRIDALENAWSVVPTKVDVLVLWWWGWGGAWAYVSWDWWGWGGWAWWLKIVDGLMLLSKVFTVSVWSWWTWWSISSNWTYWTRWNNWGNSSFWKLVALWGWWGWWAFCFYANCTNFYANDWWNWWGQWYHQSNLMNCWWKSTWLWFDWWFSWMRSGGWINQRDGWWWGWVWWQWWEFATNKQSALWSIWWKWIATCFGWTLRKLWWWWTWWAVNNAIYCNNICSCFQNFESDFNITNNWFCFWWWMGWYTWLIAWWAWIWNTWGWWGWWFCKGWAWWAWWSWLVIVRYPKDCSYWIKCATWWTITTPTINWIQYVVHTFTSWGTFEITETA